MEKLKVLELSNKNRQEIQTFLEDFNGKHSGLFDFTELRDEWQLLWKSIFKLLGKQEYAEMYPLFLNTIRILTRDEKSLQAYDISQDVECLLRLAGLHAGGVALDGSGDSPTSSTVETSAEALKCLCNLVYQNSDCRRQCLRLNVLDSIFKRFPVCMKADNSRAIELYIMKLLFLLTAMEMTARTRVQIDLNGIAYLTEWLDEKLADQVQLIEEDLELLCEMLKVMFNVTSCPDKSPNENEIQSLHLTNVLRELLLRFGDMKTERERNVVTHAINLLTNISGSCLNELTNKCEEQEASSNVLCFEKRNVRVLEIILRYLHNVLKAHGDNDGSSNELLPSVLLVLVKCCRSNALMRRYIRSVVLPPLRDVSQRPEVGSELRNYLCRFLTLPAMIVRDLTAELLFVCCKENVARMIKYTGYGNAAGLFANRGILDCRQVESAEYSSDSEDSDTEEYKQLQHSINPVLGCYEPAKSNPLEGMSEEQKEYEAMELVKLMDKLHRGGIVQPCRIGDDGKPQPIDHILQLQEELPQQQVEKKHKT